MRRVLFLLFLLLAARAPAAPAPDPSRLLTVQASLSPGASPGTGALRLQAQLVPGWHVNSHQPSEEYLIPTSVRVDPAAGVRVADPVYPPGQMRKFAFSPAPLSVYEGSFRIEVPISWSAADPPVLSGAIEYQACNDTQCLAPVSVPFRTDGAAPARGLPAAGVVSLEDVRRGPRSTTVAGASHDLGALIEREGLAAALLLAFLGGLALNLTPCVYPVIPLTVSFFGGQSGSPRRVLGLASLYVLGMASMYSALGVGAALSGRLFGVALQSPWVLSGVAAVLVLLAFSMFGYYDLRMPSFLMQRAGARAGGAGAFAMGMLVGVVAAPCVGPFVLGLLAFVAARQSAGLGFLLFFALALGLGLPYLFLGAFSGNLSRLPRAGAWMDGVKKVFGWALIAMAAYFLKTVVPAPYGDWLLPAVLTVAAVALALRGVSPRPAIRYGTAAAFLATAVFFVPRHLAAGGPAWRPYQLTAVSAARRPAVVDFSADWCLPCIELDRKTFSDPRVRDALASRALFKADLTKISSPESVALTERYAILGVPTVIFLDASGRERQELRLVGFEDAEKFLDRLAKAP
jgi:thioredoxin:protein disulfide reductase